jgi:subtilisin family serine protease
MRIAVIDSGIHEGHPHVGRVAGAVHFTADGEGSDPVDRLGHGTAVAGAIREKAPLADLFAVKVFDQRLSVNNAAILRALAWCRAERMDVINLSLGTANEEHRAPLMDAVAENGVVVSAAGLLPGELPGVVGAVREGASGGRAKRFWRRHIPVPSPAYHRRAIYKESVSRSPI